MSAVLRSPGSIEFAWDASVVSPMGAIPVLSIGAWSGVTRGEGRIARKRGLRASRTPNQPSGSGEIQVAARIIANYIRAAIPDHFDQPVSGRLIASMLTPTASPTGFSLSLDYEAEGFLGVVDVNIVTAVEFMAQNGELIVSLAPPSASAPGILPLLFNPATWVGGAVGLLGLVYLVIQNVGSGRSPLPDLGILGGIPNVLAGTSLRDLLIGPLRVHLNYRPPAFVGAVSEAGTIRLPFTYTLALRQPVVSIHAATRITLYLTEERDSAVGQLHMNAIAHDLLQPFFTWTVNGQPAGGGAAPVLELSSRNTWHGAQQSFIIGVTAVDSVDPSITSNAQIRVTGTVAYPRIPREPRYETDVLP